VVLAVVAGVRFLPRALLNSSGPANAANLPGHGSGGNQAKPSPTPLAPLPFRSAAVTVTDVNTQGFLSWALLDRRTHTIVGSSNITATITTASMIKAWLAADYLRRADEKGTTPTASQLHDLEIMIRDSDNDAGERTYAADGKTASILRLISICQLTDSKAVPNLWSNTTISARDTVRMGECIADGRAAGETWTPWLLDMMRKVRGYGDFGIREALPEDQQDDIAIKNGWLLRDEDDHWHTSCLAIGDTWVMAVLQRYPHTSDWNIDFAHTQQVCADVAHILLNPETQP
jgi:hypothetical protein